MCCFAARHKRCSVVSENGEPVGREGRAKLLAGRISCAVGVIFAVVGVVDAIAGGRASISAGALGAAIGILGYFLDANRLGTATVVLSIAALFFGLAASQGYIPGIEASDRGLPTVEPGSGN
jgi:hypothetical protein